MVSGMLQAYAEKTGKRRWGEKSAFNKHLPLQYLDESVSSLKVIHLIRDPRDVALSWGKIWCGPKWVTECALYWRTHIREKRRWGAVNRNRYLEIRYEDLVESTDAVLSRLEEFIGAECENRDMPYWESPLAKGLSKSSTHGLLGRPMQRGNTLKWKRQMSRGDLDLVESLCWDEIIELGYPTVNQERPDSAWLRMRVLKESIRGMFSQRRAKVLVKNWLPVLIRFTRALKIPMVNIFFRLCSAENECCKRNVNTKGKDAQ